jgi:Fe-S oxidoreductase
MKFQVHGIKTSQGLEKAWYMLSTLVDGRKCITVCADGYKSFSKEIREAFAVENNSEIMTDYFEKDSFRVFPEHPLFQEVAAGFRKKLAFRMKVSKYGDHARQTLEELDRLALTVA